MEDTLRLMRCLTPKQRNHSQAVQELICLVAALNFECRANRINAADIADRMKQDMAYRMRDRRERGDGGDKPPIVAAIERYKSIRLDMTLLPDDILKQMLFDGIYNADRISNALNATLYFAEPKALPSWRAFIGFDDQPDDVAEDARQRLNDDFNERRIVEPGDMLHVFALRLMQAANSLLPLSIAAAAAECRRYVDDLRAGSRLKPLPTAGRERESLNHGHDGIGYWVEEQYKKEWMEVFVYLDEQRQIVMRESLSAAAPRIIELVEQDGKALYSLLNHTADNSAEFAEVPVLASIDPAEFVKSWMKSHPRNWYWIQSSISQRFKQYDKTKNEAEAEWVKKVVVLMENEASIATGIRRVRIRRHMPRLSPAAET